MVYGLNLYIIKYKMVNKYVIKMILKGFFVLIYGYNMYIIYSRVQWYVVIDELEYI